jgi:hypothetical protein
LDADVVAAWHAADAEEQRFTVTPGVSAIAVGDSRARPVECS